MPVEFTSPAYVPSIVAENIPMSSVVGLVAALDGKSATGHTHAIANVTGLQSALDLKAPLASPSFTGTVTIGSLYVTSVSATTVAASASVNTSSLTATGAVAIPDAALSVAKVNGLQAALDGKSATGHTHTIANVTGLQGALDAKSDTGHVHSFSSLASKPTTLSGYGITDAMPEPILRAAEDGPPLTTQILVSGVILESNAGSNILARDASDTNGRGFWGERSALASNCYWDGFKWILYDVTRVWHGMENVSTPDQVGSWVQQSGPAGTPAVIHGTPAIRAGHLLIVGAGEDSPRDVYVALHTAAETGDPGTATVWAKLAEGSEVLGV